MVFPYQFTAMQLARFIDWMMSNADTEMRFSQRHQHYFFANYRIDA
jgi:hypothetical protein